MKRTTHSVQSVSSSRRGFLGRVGAAAGYHGRGAWPSLSPAEIQAADAAQEVGLSIAHPRANQAYRIRHKAALYQRGLPHPEHPTNGDDESYPRRIAGYTEALPHDALGEVDLAAYAALLHALKTDDPADYESIPRGGVVKQAKPPKLR